MRLSDLIDLGLYAAQDHADPDTAVWIDGYSVLREMLQLANGQRQVALNLGLSLPGVTSTTLTLAIGKRPAHSPWLAVSQAGNVIVRTAQARLYLDSKVGGVATLDIASLRVPILIELAEAQAKARYDLLRRAGLPTHPDRSRSPTSTRPRSTISKRR